jgi:hypothetical protein
MKKVTMAYLTEADKWMFDGIAGLSDMTWEELTPLIMQASSIVDEYCRTRFEPTEDSYSLDFTSKFYTRRRPLLDVSYLSLNGIRLSKNVDFYVYPESSRVDVVKTPAAIKKALSVKYMYGYATVPATVKQVIVELIKFNTESHSVSSVGLKSESWDDYSYEMGDATIKGSHQGILSLLDMFVEQPYVEAGGARTVRARLI